MRCIEGWGKGLPGSGRKDVRGEGDRQGWMQMDVRVEDSQGWWET